MDMSQKIIRILVTALAAFSTALFASTANNKDHDAIAERIKPVGDVYLTGAEPVVEEPTGPRDATTIYNTFCTACHATGVSGAPLKGNAEQWAPRIAQGMEILTDHAINGFNAMPVKGSCMDCSDDEIVATVEYMIEGL
ncbi:cytochrome c5 family protein [Vibrio sp. JC009]|uniref:c-type cytochrome n=1 Tax=Vibrio sp. JC009 TaxID=2912314 RepID=UPI0023B1C8F9|nr:cytochrome c5 family protein [Vibrio sp. JC009]WED21874.1 cytochrome c5 family protein [Vibrio sp. JC009]